MYLFFHLFVGLILGLILSRLRPDFLIILLCMFMSLLPDLLDKPMSLMFPELNSGRTFGHTLCFVLLIVIISWDQYKLQVLGAGSAIFLHQVFDSMWNSPTTWFYPIFGPFLMSTWVGATGNWFWSVFLLEVTSPVEWVAGIGSVLILILLQLSKPEVRNVTE